MIEIVTNTLGVLFTVGYYVFLLSYKTGQLIIEALNYTQQSLRITCSNLLTLLTVISEDFYIFLTDIMHHVDFIVNGIVSAIASTTKLLFATVEALKFIISNVYSVIFLIPSSIITGIFKAATSVTYLFSFLKRLLILFGSGVWFALTLLPLFVVYSLSMCAYFIGSFFQETADLIARGITQTRELISGAVEFVTDVPFEATAGLAVGCCIFYVILKFHLIMYGVLEEKFRQTARYLGIRAGRLRRHLRIKKEPSASDAEASRNALYDSRYCIICQEHYKCILMLPCKHVCVCSECNKRLHYINNTCPLCRREVEKTMKIFV